MNWMIENITIMLLIIGGLAFLVSLITEVTKNIRFLQKIPTDLQVIMLSMALCLLSYFAYVSYANLIVIWYLVIGAIILAFIVSFIAMYGWTKFNELWNRFKSPVQYIEAKKVDDKK